MVRSSHFESGQNLILEQRETGLFCKSDAHASLLNRFSRLSQVFRAGAHFSALPEIIVTFVLVQVLDAPVPQMGTQVVDIMQKIDAPSLDEQVIAVPKISLDRIPQRSALRRTQKAEQLVEVPTDSAYAPWGYYLLRRSSRFSPRIGFSQVAPCCRADLEHSSSESWRWWRAGRSSRFTPWTEFNSTYCGANR